MPVTFDSLPAMWSEIANAITGLDTSILTPGSRSENWTTDGTGVSAAKVDATLTVTLPVPGAGSTDLECPAPSGENLAAFKEVATDPDWRRAPVDTRQSGGFGAAGWTCYYIRSAILNACFPGVMQSANMFEVYGPFTPNMPSLMGVFFDMRDAAFSGPGGGLPLGEMTNYPDMALDLLLVLRYVSPTGGGFLGPRDLSMVEPYQQLMQFPGLSLVRLGPELKALDLLATRLNALPSSPPASDGQGIALVKLEAPEEELEESAADSDTILRRLARGVQTVLSADIQLKLPNGALVSLKRGVLLPPAR